MSLLLCDCSRGDGASERSVQDWSVLVVVVVVVVECRAVNRPLKIFHGPRV